MSRLFPIAIVLLACALLVPGIDRPFDATEPNAGWYFGAIVGNFERHGLLALRGAPLYYTLLDEPAIFGVPYLSHPPGLSWLLWLFGPAEWQMRLCTLLATIAAALGLVALARPRFGVVRAGFAGCLFVALPAIAVFSQVTYEAVVLAFGTWMLVATLRQRAAGRAAAGSAAFAGACAFLGTWIDWGFVAFCIGAIPLAWIRGRLRVTAGILVGPAVGGAAAVGTILWWKASLLGAPNLPDTSGASLDLGEMVAGTIMNRPDFDLYLAAWGKSLVECFTWPVLIASVPGIVGVWRRDRGLAIGLTLAGAFVPLLFANHVVAVHRLFFAYFAPLAALATSIAVAWISRSHEHVALRVVLVGAIGIPPVWESLLMRRIGATTFYRDLGAVMAKAATEETDDGTKRFVVLHNTNPYGVYFETERCVFVPFVDPALIGLDAVEAKLGVRFLLVDSISDTPLPGQGPGPLADFLEHFPHEPVPDLRASFFIDPPTRGRFEVRGAKLYTLRDATPVR